MSCPTCTARNSDIIRTSQKRATRTAHLLATEECKLGSMDPRMQYVDLYMMMFHRIYEHEYRRNMYVELQRRNYTIRMSSTQWNDACDYHAEFDDDYCAEVMKKVEQEYARSKWPNYLPQGA